MSCEINGNGKAGIVALALFIFVFMLVGLVQPDMAAAKTDYSEPATSLTLVLNEDGEAFELATYSISELEKMPQVEREYSSIDMMPAPVFTAGKGLDLGTFLSSQGIDLGSISQCRFYATDNVVKTMKRDLLFDRSGYYFPQIVKYWESDWDENSNCYIDVSKVGAGAVPVKPMLAIRSSQERWLDSPDWGNLDGSSCLRLCLGQASPEECSTMNFVRWIYKIEVFGKLQSGGGGSAVLPRVSLDKPAANQSYQVGDRVEIAGTVERMSSLTLTISDPDGYIVYTAFDIEAKDGKFSEEFPLGPDAVPGSYIIEAGPKAGSSLSSKQSFKVVAASAAKADILLDSPEAGHSVPPGTKVRISGSLQGLKSAKLEILDPGKKSLYSGTIDKSGDFSEEYLLAADAVNGDYSIIISGPGMKEEFTRVFKVDSNPANTPAAEPKNSAKPGTSIDSFKDTIGHWAADKINELVALGAIKGYPDGSFQPDGIITRAEYTTVVAKAFKLTAADSACPADSSGHWARDYITAAIAAGIVGDYDGRSFAPDEAISRQQMASMAVKAAQVIPAADANHFTDKDSIADWAREDVAAAVDKQIIKGYPDNSFKPDGKASRAEASTVIVNALKLLP